MQKFFTGFLFVLCLATSIFAKKIEVVDLILFNGKIFTAEPQNKFEEAVAIKSGRIVGVGKTKAIRTRFKGKKDIDLKGKLVTPGFNDSHIHFLGVGLAMLEVDLNGAQTIEEARARILKSIKEAPKGTWVTGRGWDHTLWNNRLPTRADLDDISPNNPVFLERVDGHISWANSAAIKLAGITSTTKDPEGGEIVRDSSGEAAGVVKETAQGLIYRVIPPPSKEQMRKGINLAIQEANKYGLTSVQGGADYESIPIYRDILNEGKLSVRVAIWQNFDSSITDLIKERNDFVSLKLDPDRIKLGIVKGFMDGSLGSRTAAMIEPYSDDPRNKGILRRSPDETISMIRERADAGFQIGLHAIGDRGVKIALDGFQKVYDEKRICSSIDEIRSAWKGESKSIFPCRFRIEHSQVVEPSDFKRYRKLGVIASMQPTHAISDKRWAEARIGESRVLGAYAWHTFQDLGIPVAFGTDSPVEPLNPYLTLYAAVSRQSADGEPVGGWYPRERLSMADAIRDYSLGSAYAEFSENEKGSISVGKYADLIVHSRDLFSIPVAQILKTRPVTTIFNGQIVYEAATTKNKTKRKVSIEN